MTTAEYLQTPESTRPSELVFGQLRVAEAPSPSHQRVVRELLLALAQETTAQGAGEVLCAPLDVVLDFAANLVVQPDLVFVSKDRDHIVRDRIYGPPDLAIEVEVSRSMGKRRSVYAELGVPELWRFDGQRVTVMELVGDAYAPVERSRFFPALEMIEFSEFVLRTIRDQRTGVREYRKLLRSRKGPSNQ